MANFSADSFVNTFKKVYGGMQDLIFKETVIDELFPFDQSQRVGESFVEAFVLGQPGGISYLGSSQGVFSLNDAVSMTVQQSKIIPSQTVMSDVISFAFASRGITDEASFVNSTQLIVKSHLKAHNSFVNIAKLYGQSDAKLGYVSFAPSGTVYRGASYSGSGNITLTRPDGSTISFVAGVTTTTGITGATGAILLAPGQYAANFWVGRKDTKVKQLNAAGAVVASGSIVSTDANLGILYVNFVPVAASSTTSHKLCYDGWENNGEMVGVQKILANQTGTLFDINAGQYELWRGTNFNVGGKAFSLDAVQSGIAYAVNSGGLDKPLDILVNPNTHAKLISDQAALRKYDQSYSSKKADNGFEVIEFYSANGINRIHATPMVKEGDAFGLVREEWRCSGSQVPSFKLNGIGSDIIQPIPNQTGWSYRSYGDVYVFCRAPAKNIYWYNLNFENVSY